MHLRWPSHLDRSAAYAKHLPKKCHSSGLVSDKIHLYGGCLNFSDIMQKNTKRITKEYQKNTKKIANSIFDCFVLGSFAEVRHGLVREYAGD
jgi:hypothetical protein